MKNALLRVAMWAGGGLLVSVCWGIYFASANKALPIEPIVHTLARVTQPTAAVLLHIKPGLPLGLTWVAVANAATYALLGSITEAIGRSRRSLHISN